MDNRTVVTSKRSQYIDGVVQCRDCCTSDICNAYGCGSPSKFGKEYAHVMFLNN